MVMTVIVGVFVRIVGTISFAYFSCGSAEHSIAPKAERETVDISISLGMGRTFIVVCLGPGLLILMSIYPDTEELEGLTPPLRFAYPDPYDLAIYVNLHILRHRHLVCS